MPGEAAVGGRVSHDQGGEAQQGMGCEDWDNTRHTHARKKD